MKSVSLQAGAVNVQWQLKSNMCAQFINIDPEDVEVARLVPRATDRVIRFEPRPEDADFSRRLAGVVLRHVEGLVAQMSQVLPGMLTAQLWHDCWLRPWLQVSWKGHSCSFGVAYLKQAVNKPHFQDLQR